MKCPYGERRSRLRFSVELIGTLVVPLGTPAKGSVSVQVREVSFNGLLLELPEEVRAGDEVSLQVCFPGEGKGDKMVSMEGTVVRCARGGTEGTSFQAGVRLKGMPEGLKEGLLRLLPQRAETASYVEKSLSLNI